jgi:hypothetical protein
MTPFASVAMQENFGLLKIALFRALAVRRASVGPTFFGAAGERVDRKGAFRIAALDGRKGVARSAGYRPAFRQVREAGWWEFPRVDTQWFND